MIARSPKRRRRLIFSANETSRQWDICLYTHCTVVVGAECHDPWTMILPRHLDVNIRLCPPNVIYAGAILAKYTGSPGLLGSLIIVRIYPN